MTTNKIKVSVRRSWLPAWRHHTDHLRVTSEASTAFILSTCLPLRSLEAAGHPQCPMVPAPSRGVQGATQLTPHVGADLRTCGKCFRPAVVVVGWLTSLEQPQGLQEASWGDF